MKGHCSLETGVEGDPGKISLECSVPVENIMHKRHILSIGNCLTILIDCKDHGIGSIFQDNSRFQMAVVLLYMSQSSP